MGRANAEKQGYKVFTKMAIVELSLPYRGVSKGLAVDKTPPDTTGDIMNVRPIDVLAQRLRLGQRPGLKKWGAGTQVGAAEQPVVAICVVESVK